MWPLLCLGTFIGTDPESTAPRIFSRVTMPRLAGGWCLACGEVIDLHQAAQELADPAMRAELIARGYLDAVPAPAVYWVNTISAAMGVRLVHGALAGFVETKGGVDEITDLALDLGSVDPDVPESPVMRLAHDLRGCFVCGPFAP